MIKTDEAELLAWLDGDLTPERRVEIQQQLETDWELRNTLAQLERRIGKYIEATAHQSPAEIEPFDDFWQRFAPQLDGVAAPQTSPRRAARVDAFIMRLAKLMQPQRYGWRLASVVAITGVIVSGLILYLALSTRVRPVSAEELLQRSINGEAPRLRQLPEPVVYRKLQVKRVGGGEPITWESWNDAQRKQFRQRVADKQGLRFLRTNEKAPPPIIVELEQIFRANHFDPQRPLSAAAFATWRKSIRAQAETIIEQTLPGNENDGLKLTTIAEAPYAINAITTASLVVRKSDWHAVTLYLDVQGAHEIREYELSEIAYEVLPLQALTVFADLAPTPMATALPAPSALALASPSLTPATLALQEAEVAAVYALHLLQADLGEQIEVVRDGDKRIIVRGLVEADERKQQLNEALRALPLVTMQILTVEEAQRAAARQVRVAPPSVAPGAVTETTSHTDQPNPQQQAFRAALERYFASSGGSSAQRFTELTNGSLAHSEAALARAWALRRLAENPALKQTAPLSPEAKARLVTMLRSHLQELREQMRGLRGELEPCLLFVAGGSASSKATRLPANQAAEWTSAALTIFTSVSQLDRQLHRMFSPGGVAEPPAVAAREVLSDFAEIETALRLLKMQSDQMSVDK